MIDVVLDTSGSMGECADALVCAACSLKSAGFARGVEVRFFDLCGVMVERFDEIKERFCNEKLDVSVFSNLKNAIFVSDGHFSEKKELASVGFVAGVAVGVCGDFEALKGVAKFVTRGESAVEAVDFVFFGDANLTSVQTAVADEEDNW